MSTTRERYLEWKNRYETAQLPIEIWAKIFSHLSFVDLVSVRLVSRLFNACVSQFTDFWSCAIVNLDMARADEICPTQLKNIRFSNIDLLTKTKLYSHCTAYFNGRPRSLMKTKRKRRLLLSIKNESSSTDEISFRCSSIHFQSLRGWEPQQLESLLQRRIRRFACSYECLSNEPSLSFLLKLDRLKYVKIHFIHAIDRIDAFSIMLMNTMQHIVSLIVRLPRYSFEGNFPFTISFNDERNASRINFQ